MSESEKPYLMTLSLNVLNHLGIGLYSNVPAVLSEVVANAWDADATEVKITLSNDRISIEDNGIGMTKDDINKKYLMVGYRKREVEPPLTQLGRSPMGRKGIGKLSVFSLARIIEIQSVKDGEQNGLVMVLDDIKSRIEGNDSTPYFPQPISSENITLQIGTKIVLSDLKKGLATTAESNLRKRLARRFSVIGSNQNFRVWVNGLEISARDRDYYARLEFLWCLGEESKNYVGNCPNLREYFVVDNLVSPKEGYRVKGWIGTIDEHKNAEDNDNNIIVVYAQGKLIQEDILKEFTEGGVYSKYLIGDIDADFMDLNDKDDIVTSNRQSVKEDDPRYEDLKTYVKNILKTIQSNWTKLRNKVGTERALMNPKIKEWYNTQQGDNKKYAEKLFGKIESLKLPDANAKKELYRSSLLAFERMAITNSLSILDTLDSEKDFEVMSKIFENVDELEAVLYYEIARSRVAVVREFEKILPNSQERVLQRHIFDHLWLLDASWDRAASNFKIEESVIKEFAKMTEKLTEDERAGRIDIRYKTAAGKHIIIELKKYDRKVSATELVDQLRKYRSALNKCLKQHFPDESRVIECICILGSPPTPDDEERENIDLLKTINARYITYDTLVHQTLRSYQEYLDKEKRVSNLIKLLDGLDEHPSQNDDQLQLLTDGSDNPKELPPV